MKKTILILLLAVTSCVLFAQTKKTKQCTNVFPQELLETELNDKINFTGQCIEGSNILHGPFTATGSNAVKRNGVQLSYNYSSSGKYVEDKLDGPLSITMKVTCSMRGNTFTLTNRLNANYSNGEPNGVWKHIYEGVLNGKNEKKTMTVTYKNGNIKSYIKDGNSVEKNDDGSLSGHIGNVSFSHGILLYELDNEALAIVKGIESGEISLDSLHEYGYMLESNINFYDIIADDLHYWNVYLGLVSKEGYWRYANYVYSYSGLPFYDRNSIKRAADETFVNENDPFYACDLIKLDVTSSEEVIQMINDKYASSSLEEIYSAEIKLCSGNTIEYDGWIYYYADSTREDIKPCIKALKEKRSKEIAFNKRVGEYKQALSEKYTSVSDKYKAYTFLADECVAFSVIKQNCIDSRDTISIQRAIDLGDYVDSLCAKNITLYSLVSDALEMTKTKYSELNSMFNNNFLSYNCDCSSFDKQEQFEEKIQYVEDWIVKTKAFCDAVDKLPIIDKNSSDIKANEDKCVASLVKFYVAEESVVDTKITDDYVASLAKLSAWVERQENYSKIIDLHKKLTEKGKECKECKNILKVYNTYFKDEIKAWTSDISIETLSEIRSIQAKFDSIVSAPNVEELDQAVKKSKDKSLNTVLEICK